MKVRSILLKLADKGITIKHESGKLKFFGDLSSLSPEDKNEIVNAKQDIIDYLTARSSNRKFIRKTGKDKVALSFAQQRLWFIDSLQGGSPEYNMPMAFEVAGQLNLALVSDALTTILERHQVLRTVYVEEAGETLQHIRSMRDIAFDIKVQDLTHLTGELLDAQVKSLAEADIARAFELSSDLMLRVSYLKKTADTGVIIFNMHHIASDGWSMQLLVKEFFALFGAYSRGQANPLPELDIQYADYAHWQHEQLAGDAIESQLGYWQKQLNELPALHSLPLDYARPEVKQHKAAEITGKLPAAVAGGLLNVAKAHKLTPFMLLHGALSLLLSRHSNSHDIVIGTPVANRLHAELEPLIGFFVNTLVLRADTRHDTLSDYFAHIRQVHLDAQSNQDVPFEQLVERLKAPRSSAHSPLFQIIMTTNTDYGLNDDADNASFTLPGVDIEPYQSDLSQAKFDLEIGLNISEQGVGLHWTYDTALFSAQHIAGLNEHMCRLLEGLSLAQEPYTLAPHELPVLSEDETRHLVLGLNDTAVTYPQDKCIHELFEQQAAACPDNVAVVFEDKQLTYKQLNEKANRLAHYLKEHHGIVPDTLVGLCVERSLEMMIAILGILKAGGAYVPLDPGYPQERLNYMLENASLQLVLSQVHLQRVLAGFNGAAVMLDGLGEIEQTEPSVSDHLSVYGNANLTTAQTGVSSSSLAYVIYTSGSTGKPKGSLLAHRGLCNLTRAQASAFKVTAQSRVLQFASVAFDAATSEWAMALCTGARLCLASRQQVKDPSLLDRIAADLQISHATLPPALLPALDQASWRQVSHLVVAGESCPLALAKEWAQGRSFYNAYGPSETTVCTSIHEFDREADYRTASLPIGRAMDNTQLYVLDNNKNVLPLGAVGELYIGGVGLSRGYLNQEAMTAEKFIPNLFSDESEARLYKTGDLVRRLPDGQLEFIGRADDQVKIRGFRIEPGEVEVQLVQLEVVDSALVMVKEVAGSRQLVAYVKAAGVLAEDKQAELVQTVLGQLKTRLPAYMIPGIIMVVTAWPLTPNGKIDKKALPAADANALQGEYVAPQTATEQALTEIWASLLNLEAGSVSTSASFFELGGHSLLTVKLLALIHSRFEKACELSALFAETTIQSQAALLDSMKSGLSNTELLHKVTHCSAPKEGIIFIPGVAGTAKDFMAIIERLQPRIGEQVEIGVLRHKGLIAGEQAFETIKENISAFADSLAGIATTQLTLVGHSYGGALALSLANHLTSMGYQIKVVMLDTYFEQEKMTDSANTRPAGMDIPAYLQELYQHQSRLFTSYQPSMAGEMPATMVFANQSPFTQHQYMGYLDEKLSGKKIDYQSVDGDHFTMLTGRSADLISEIIKNKGNS